jgi:hypothetical protein
MVEIGRYSFCINSGSGSLIKDNRENALIRARFVRHKRRKKLPPFINIQYETYFSLFWLTNPAIA